MKFVKNVGFASVLASVLAVSALAGEQSTPGFAAPSPTPTPQVIYVSDDGTVCDPNAESTDTSDYLVYEALVALLSMY